MKHLVIEDRENERVLIETNVDDHTAYLLKMYYRAQGMIVHERDVKILITDRVNAEQLGEVAVAVLKGAA